MAGRRKENDREELKLRVVETASKSFIPLTDSRVDINSLDLLFSIFKNILSSDEDIVSTLSSINLYLPINEI